MTKMIKKSRAGQAILGALLGVSLLAGTAVPAHADQDEGCRRDVHRAEQNLDKAIRKHGEHSRQAEDSRRRLNRRMRTRLSGGVAGRTSDRSPYAG